jgi:Tfp pilus assembly protein PilF
MLGHPEEAIAAADLLARESSSATDTMAEMVDFVAPYPLFSRLRFNRWSDVLTLPQPNAKLLTSSALWHWGRALAYTRTGDQSAAQREAALFRSAVSMVPGQRSWMTSRSADVLALAGAVLDARLSPDDREATGHLQRAVAIQDRLSYDEPPPWYTPLRESLGGALLRAGDASAAEVVFREGLRRSPRNGRLLFGLMKSLEAQRKTESAVMVRDEFDRAWQGASVTLRIEDL